ncbi:MAG: restriction endonuclease subunit S [Chloroflexi bacterium]|nr:restriction endonuclease subunit S [Chloroflexota bacterium]
MKWAKQPLGNVAELCLGKMLDEKKNKGQPLPYLANINVRWGSFDLDNLREMRFEENELERYGLKFGDIVMCEGGEPGRCAIWKDGKPGMMIQKAIHRIRPHEGLDYRFLYYDFLLKGKTGAFTPLFTGATIKHLPGQNLAKVEVSIPPLEIQRRIADILSAYDDLIENNRRRIDLLEQSARLLYKEWFVSLRFPGHEHVKVKDGVPQGWEVSTVADVCSSFDDGDWIESKDQGGEDYRLLQISNIGDDDFVETGNFRYVTEQTFRRLNCNEVKPGDILLARMPDPIGRGWYVTEQPWKMITAVDVTIARPDQNKVNPFYYLYHINSPVHLALCAARATGATRPRVSRKNLGALPILVPPLSLQNEFGNSASKINQMKTTLRRQVKQLQKARDLLLPRLMNGEIPV